MKKSLFTKILTVVGAAVLTLPAVLGVGSSTAKAADTIPTQKVELTKFAYNKSINGDETTPGSDQEMLTPKDTDGQKTLDGVTFEVYDVTQQYWDNIKKYTDKDGNVDQDAVNGNGKFTLSDAFKTGVTANGGKIDFDLPVYSTVTIGNKQYKKQAIYVFHEVDGTANADYKTQPDFVLSLPKGSVDKDGNYSTVYVYPKNDSTTTHDLEFVKKDSETGANLAGAEFVIKNKDGKYAQVLDDKGNKVSPVTGFSPDPVEVKWVSSKDDATRFASDADGKFGFTSYTESTLDGSTYGLKAKGDYTYEETKAPAGYDGDATGDINEQNGDNDAALVVNNKPQGLLPHTGGKGIVAFVVAGVALIALGGLAYSKRRAA